MTIVAVITASIAEAIFSTTKMTAVKTIIIMMIMVSEFMVTHHKHCRGNVHCRLSSRAVSRWLRSSRTPDPLQKKLYFREFGILGFVSWEEWKWNIQSIKKSQFFFNLGLGARSFDLLIIDRLLPIRKENEGSYSKNIGISTSIR